MSGIGASWRISPSRPGAMCGDWIDVVRLEDGRLAVSIGDAAGHGDRAAALALVLRRLLRDRLLGGADPGQALGGALAEVAELGDMGEMYATAFVAVAAADGTVTYANAGHPAPIVLRSRGPRDRGRTGTDPGEVGRSLGPTGPLLSDLFAGAAIWSNRTLRLAPGESLVLYTDGLTEARNLAGVEFGSDRLAAAGWRSTEGRVPGRGRRPSAVSGVLDRMFAEVAAFTQRASDDRSALVLTCVPEADGQDGDRALDDSGRLGAAAEQCGVG
ncbi:serine/threonine-protein phosphatase [Frankia sp. Mgl5]|uniref:PP2C family protein-serine/threonine phosphatase n=1 Tax=Frankia sp. Mgl5 TaxID=2933793 RepID=UPI00200D4FB0|nr:PP2C family protein-serine/threonine phosphatase [Frankia sp. Mgl5]MCK9925973.1 serine/threonine-protein phosphatase [Frankia sp. Mgl5]